MHVARMHHLMENENHECEDKAIRCPGYVGFRHAPWAFWPIRVVHVAAVPTASPLPHTAATKQPAAVLIVKNNLECLASAAYCDKTCTTVHVQAIVALALAYTPICA